MRLLIRFVAVCSWCVMATTARADFALHDGDTVAFLGDSITAARGYTKIVEHYTLMRFPERRVRFVNAGKGGDTATSAIQRLERDVFGRGATVVTVALGVNDIGWGMKADAVHKQAYLDGIRTIIERCQARKVRVFICSPAITAEAPDKSENGFLQRMADEGFALSTSLGARTIDLQRPMRETQRRIMEANSRERDAEKQTKLHAEDGVHLNDLGQLAMAYAMLKGLGAPADVSSVSVDAASLKVMAADGCAVSKLDRITNGIAFTRLDRGLPLNLGILSGLNHRWVPIPEGINRYLLTVTNLPAGNYEIRAEGRRLGKVSAERLARGLNIASMTADGWEPGGPWDAQSGIVKELVDARDKLWMAALLRSHYNANHPAHAKLDRQTRDLDERLVEQQRAQARPPSLLGS